MKLTKTAKYFWGSIFVLLFVYLALSLKNPFSPNSIIPNLEPYPDPFYYAQPAWNFVHGEGFEMKYSNFHIVNIVPPLYSFYLVPFFALFRDVRVFYFANLILMLFSIVLFYVTLRNISGQKSKHIWVPFLTAIFFITNYYIYTLPSLLLAENLSLFFLCLGIYLLSAPLTKMRLILMGVTGSALLLTKFSNFPLGVTLYILFAHRVLKEQKNREKIGLFLTATTISLFVFWRYYINREIEIVPATDPLANLQLFHPKYLISNTIFYLRALAGGDTNFLWYTKKFISPLFSILALYGVYMALREKKSRTFAAYILVLIVATVGFQGTFYSTDVRYIIVLLPVLLAAVAYGFTNLFNLKRGVYLVVFIVALYLFAPFVGQDAKRPTGIMLLRQVAVTIVGKEKGWFYIAIAEFNSFFSNPQYQGAYLGTFLPPFLIEYYSNNTYNYLPLSKTQDFFTHKGNLSERFGIVTIEDYYTSLLKKNKRIFITNVFAGNKREWGDEIDALKTRFDATLVKEACMGSCNIYELRLR